ncbi:MAG: hypothetical protein M1818_008007 [Claussenomyces sp. TS43310]|nr:MAG: hypothetical protein M1818_008007 [Claussenomyces sp. TS43310]
MTPESLDGLSEQISDLDVPRRRQPSYMSSSTETPPAPPIHSKAIVATDITDQFVKAAGQLDVGQVIKDDYFTLFESVGAIELMDPKMDTGFLAEGDTIDDEYDVGRSLLPEEVLGIIDKLLCLEMAWHMGHPLSQTLFTSLYIDEILGSTPDQNLASQSGGKEWSSEDIALHQILRAYCLGLIKTCWHVNNRVQSEHFYEEEDFVTHTYNRNLLDDVDDEIIFNYLEKARISSSTSTSEIWKALGQRLTFRTAFLKTVSLASERTSIELKTSWDNLLMLLPGLKTAGDLAVAVPASFSVKLQRMLASTVPPRPIVTVAFDAAYAHLEKMCYDGQALTRVLKYYDSQSLITFVALFQARNPQPSVYIRTLLQHYLFGEMIMLGTMSIRQILDDDLASIVLPGDQLLDRANDDVEVPQDPRFNMATRMEIFRSRAAQSFLDVLRTLCQNRCRTRRTLHHAIADWDVLQLDAEELDIELRAFTKEQPIREISLTPEPIYQFPLSSWCYLYKLRQMEWHVQMGFELEVYQPDELAGMYWYLQHLASIHLAHLERIRIFVLRKRTSFLKASTRQSSAADAKAEQGFERTLSYLNAAMLKVTATFGFAEALSSLHTVLLRLSLVRTPSLPYSNDDLRYDLRMKSFLHISLPELVPRAQFQSASMQVGDSSATVLRRAADAAARARKDYELLSKLDAKTARCQGCEEAWGKDVKDCLKACIMTSISISMATKALEAGGEPETKYRVEMPEAGKGYHDWWVVPRIVAK